jgi:hypothetical protein
VSPKALRWLLLVSGTFWVIDGVPDVLDGPLVWGLLQIAVGAGLLLGHRRFASWVERGEQKRLSRRRDEG